MSFRVRITASVSITICGIAIAADWLPRNPKWLEYDRNCGQFRLPDCLGGEVRFGSGAVLNPRIQHGLTLKPCESVSGYIALVLPEKVPPSGATKAAVLWIQDLFGRQYPYRLELCNSQQIEPSGDSSCHFVSAAELARERAQQQAAEAERAQRQRELEAKPKVGTLAAVLDRVIAEEE